METWGRYLIVAAFALHGIGMLGGGLTLPLVQRKPDSAFGHSWLLSRLGALEPVIGTILWGLAGLGFIVAAAGFGLDAEWWRLGAWVGAPLTIVVVVLWYGAVPPGTYVGGVLAALTIGALVIGAG